MILSYGMAYHIFTQLFLLIHNNFSSVIIVSGVSPQSLLLLFPVVRFSHNVIHLCPTVENLKTYAALKYVYYTFIHYIFIYTVPSREDRWEIYSTPIQFLYWVFSLPKGGQSVFPHNPTGRFWPSFI